jgi:hypothetical protein
MNVLEQEAMFDVNHVNLLVEVVLQEDLMKQQ